MVPIREAFRKISQGSSAKVDGNAAEKGETLMIRHLRSLK